MPTHTDTRAEDIELVFLSAVNILTKKHGCKLINCDFAKRRIEIEGSEDKQLKVAFALDKFLSQWKV